MTIKLLNAHCLVKPDAPITALQGIQLPDQLVRKPSTGTVVTVGQYYFNNGTKMDFDLKPGDKVQYRPYEGDPIIVDGEELLLLALAQLIGVVVDD